MSKILIFDSGVGGISVYQSIKKQLPHADYIYLFDDDHFPYGELDESFLITRVSELIAHMYEIHKPDIVVIACNSASTLVLPTLRKLFPIPFVGVVPAIKPAALLSQNKHIGLLATPGTVEREYTKALISEYAHDCRVDLIGSTALVVEAENKLRGKGIDLSKLHLAIEPWVSNSIKPDVVILGCTHFPLLKDELKNVLGPNVDLIDSGKAIALRVESLIANTQVINSKADKQKEVFFTKKEGKKKLTQLFLQIGLGQPQHLDLKK